MKILLSLTILMIFLTRVRVMMNFLRKNLKSRSLNLLRNHPKSQQVNQLLITLDQNLRNLKNLLLQGHMRIERKML